MGRGAGSRIEGHQQYEVKMYSAAIVGGTATSGAGSIYDISEYGMCALVVNIAGYTGTGNIVISLQDCPTNATTYAVNHATTSGNLSANGNYRVAIGDISMKYGRIKYTVAAGASATVIVYGLFKS